MAEGWPRRIFPAARTVFSPLLVTNRIFPAAWPRVGGHRGGAGFLAAWAQAVVGGPSVRPCPRTGESLRRLLFPLSPPGTIPACPCARSAECARPAQSVRTRHSCHPFPGGAAGPFSGILSQISGRVRFAESVARRVGRHVLCHSPFAT